MGQPRVVLPTIQPSCIKRRSLPIKTLLQPCDADAGVLHFKKDSEWQYFSRRHRARRHVGFFKMRHPSFASRESLKEVISLNPRPPFLFGFAIFSRISQSLLRSNKWIWYSMTPNNTMCHMVFLVQTFRQHYWMNFVIYLQNGISSFHFWQGETKIKWLIFRWYEIDSFSIVGWSLLWNYFQM